MAVVLRRLALGLWLRAYADSLPRGLVKRQFIADGRWFATRWLQNLDGYRLLLVPVVRVGGACESWVRIEATRPEALDGCGRRID